MGKNSDVQADSRIQQRKLRLALTIMALGMGIGLIWHGWQGLVLHRSYPYNTFLFDPRVRGTDFTNFLDPVVQAINPYGYGNYFPAAYLVFDLFCGFPLRLGVTLFVRAF